MKDWKVWLISLSIEIPILIALVIGSIHLDRKKYFECLDNSPSIDWVEEDLEPIFMTTDIIIYGEDQEEDSIAYDFSANGFYYRAEYKLTTGFFMFNYYWKYARHIEIAKAEVNNMFYDEVD